MSSRSDEYRQRAAEAKNRAAQTSSPYIKSAFEDVARGWLQLAEQRILLNCYIAGTFIALQYLVCLTYIFLKL
jgi:hypothetical protein